MIKGPTSLQTSMNQTKNLQYILPNGVGIEVNELVTFVMSEGPVQIFYYKFVLKGKN